MGGFLTQIGLKPKKDIYENLSKSTLVEHAILLGEGKLCHNGVLNMDTTPYTGRLAGNRFIVDSEKTHDEIAWGKINQPVSSEVYEQLRGEVIAHLEQKDLYILDGYAGADKDYAVHTRILNESPTQTLFMRNMLIQDVGTGKSFSPGLTMIVAGSYKCNVTVAGKVYNAMIILNLDKNEILICGTKYSGEIKKSVFSFMNYLLPSKGVLPMHCSANCGADGHVALFFGLSGTGKTTLSNDPHRFLIGDDEHAWSDKGVFNIEGGVYAKTYQLKEENEPYIWNAMRFGAVSENITLADKTRIFDFEDKSVTENTRVSFPLTHIKNIKVPSIAGHPNAIIFLTADAFGVLPPVSKLSKPQAMYHFMSGYTSKLAGTEVGITEPVATFSTCFGAPFFPLPAETYAEMLGEKMEKHETSIFLVNTGWTGGPFGVGNRISLKITRSIIDAILEGKLDDVEYRHDTRFNLDVPVSCPNVPDDVLVPENTWADKAAYQEAAKSLAQRFVENFKRYPNASEEITSAGPVAE